MELKKVLFVSQEMAPYLPETRMSVMSRKMAERIHELGAEVRVFMPNYGMINERRYQLHEAQRLTGMNIVIDDTDHPLFMKVATLQPARIQIYFIFNDDYFTPKLAKQLELDSSPADNDERSIFFVRAVIETVRKMRWNPDVIQCSGWVTALAPIYMRQIYAVDPSFRDAKIVYALFDNDFDQPLDSRLADKLKQDEIPEEYLKAIEGKEVDYLALTQLALDHCDAVVQCSPTIKPEVLELVEKSGLPFLPYQNGDLPEDEQTAADAEQPLPNEGENQASEQEDEAKPLVLNVNYDAYRDFYASL
ncbi:MAG: glycogen/starch synthase [Muribaculaceae bacterium]|nr:glycogen/starch synthase [Muribaculaceae bacterium]